MTLFRQLFLGASILFFVILTGVEAIYLRNASHYLQQQLQASSQDAATSLSLWLSTIKPFEDRALIETVVSASFDRGYFTSIRVVSIRGETLASKELPPALGEVPAWFARLFPLRPPSAEALISSGWRQLGRVLVVSHPNFAYLQLWHTAQQTLALLVLVYLLALLAIRFFLRSILRPLVEVEKAADAIGERDFRTIDLAPRTRELARVVAAMNSLSGKIRHFIEDELTRADKVQREAYFDAVTGLYNRRGLEQQLQGQFRAGHDVFSSVFLLLELERFKNYNLRLGYQRADQLLALVAQTIIAACAGRSVMCARFAGAGFALAMVNIDEDAARALVSEVSLRVEAAMAEQDVTDEIPFHCGAAYYYGGTPSLAELLASADMALARAREIGPNTFELVVVSELERGGRGALDWRRHIEDAIESGHLALFVQAALSLPGRALLQHEVTTRIVADASDPIPAARFMPMAARFGLMPRLDCRVLELLIESVDAGAALAPVIAINVVGANPGRCRRLRPGSRVAAIPPRRRLAPGVRNDRIRRGSGPGAKPYLCRRSPAPGSAVRDRPFRTAPGLAQAAEPVAAALRQAGARLYQYA